MDVNRFTSVQAVFVAILLAVGLGNAVAQPADTKPKNSPAKVVMTEELMARLIRYTRTDKTGSFSARLAKVLDLNDGSTNLPMKFSIGDATDGEHYFGVPPNADSKDVLIVVKRDTILEAYLTDKTCKLRAAAVLENGAARLITNEKAEKKFQAELAQFAKEAAEQLPPSDAPDPDKKK